MSWKKFNFQSVSCSWHMILLVICKRSAWAFLLLSGGVCVGMKTLQLTVQLKKAIILVWIQLRSDLSKTNELVIGLLSHLKFFSLFSFSPDCCEGILWINSTGCMEHTHSAIISLTIIWYLLYEKMNSSVCNIGSHSLDRSKLGNIELG